MGMVMAMAWCHVWLALPRLVAAIVDRGHLGECGATTGFALPVLLKLIMIYMCVMGLEMVVIKGWGPCHTPGRARQGMACRS
jgi:hypothetical protein